VRDELFGALGQVKPYLLICLLLDAPATQREAEHAADSMERSGH
jgi:hypothetical protein